MGIVLQLQDDNNLIGQPQFEEVGRNYNKQLNETKTHPTTADQPEHKQPCHSSLPAEWQDSSQLLDDTVTFLYKDKRDWTTEILHDGNWKTMWRVDRTLLSGFIAAWPLSLR